MKTNVTRMTNGYSDPMPTDEPPMIRTKLGEIEVETRGGVYDQSVAAIVSVHTSQVEFALEQNSRHFDKSTTESFQ